MGALGIDQHQGLVRRHAAQSGGAQGVGAIGDGGMGEVQRGQVLGQRLRQVGGAGVLDLRSRDHIDGDDGVELGARGGAAAGHDDGFDIFIVRNLLRESAGGGNDGKNARGQGERGQAFKVHGNSFRDNSVTKASLSTRNRQQRLQKNSILLRN